MNEKCDHLITKGKEGRKGLWCINCGYKVYDVESRKCVDCVHSKKDNGYAKIMSCTKHRMVIIDSMNVTYKIS